VQAVINYEGICIRYNIFGNMAGWRNKWWCL